MALATLLAGVGPVCAQTDLHDPMRPIGVAAASALTASVSLGSPDTEVVAAPQPLAGSINVLVIGAQRQFALIDGVLVHPGESVNQWRLVSIHHQGVVMRHASQIQEIKLHPSAVKTIRPTHVNGSTSDPVDNKPSRKLP